MTSFCNSLHLIKNGSIVLDLDEQEVAEMFGSLSDDDVIDFQTFFELIVGNSWADLIYSWLEMISALKWSLFLNILNTAVGFHPGILAWHCSDLLYRPKSRFLSQINKKDPLGISYCNF